MKQIVKKFMVGLIMLFVFACVMGNTEDAQAKKKVKSYKVTMGKNGKTLVTYAYKNAKKVKWNVSKKGIVSVKRGGFAYANMQLRAKKAGKTTVTVKATLKSGKKQTYRYNVTVKGSATVREVFDEQNKVRKKAKVAPLEWSEELYQFAKYRLQTSGYDEHENLARDRKNYFGDREVKSLGENMAQDASSFKVIGLWVGSPGHYENMVNKGYKSGAICCVNGDWTAIFSRQTSEEIKKATDMPECKTVVTRKDSATGTLLSGCQFTIAKVSDGSIICSVGILDGKTETATTKLVPGETYKIYEVITPAGYTKAKPLIFTVTEGINHITMTD